MPLLASSSFNDVSFLRLLSCDGSGFRRRHLVFSVFSDVLASTSGRKFHFYFLLGSDDAPIENSCLQSLPVTFRRRDLIVVLVEKMVDGRLVLFHH